MEFESQGSISYDLEFNLGLQKSFKRMLTGMQISPLPLLAVTTTAASPAVVEPHKPPLSPKNLGRPEPMKC